MVVKRHPFNLHIVLWRAEDVPGQWLAHCLELDVVSQGNSLPHALEMVKEAIETVIVADLQKGLDPARRRAPQEEWDAMWARLQSAHPRPLAEVTRGEPSFVVIESVMTVTEITAQDLAAIRAGASPAPVPPDFTVPVAFAPAEHAP
jgi:predicted RNase H-like HicB family nuclease